MSVQGGVPHPRSRWGGGTPSQVQVGGGYPVSGPGGVPHLRSGGGTQSQVWGGIPSQVRGGTHSTPPRPRNSKHLLWLRGGRYASCVHAGGLSCSNIHLFSLQKEYSRLHPRGELPVKANDAMFSINAVSMNIIVIIQCLVFERGDQKVTSSYPSLRPTYILMSHGYIRP